MSEEQLLQLTTQQLDYLVAVADAPTWADAAAKLGVSQSALSQGLSQLERRVGIVLFDRDGRRRVLRPEASGVVDYARLVVAETRSLGRWARAVGEGGAGELRVGMIDLAATVQFGSTLQRFRAHHPDLRLHLGVAPSAALSDALLAGELSLAVIVDSGHPTGDLEYTPLISDELAIYGPQGSERTDRADWGPWVTFPSSSHTRHLVANRLAEMGVTFDVVAESHQPEVLRGMVALGMGWTVLPVRQAETEPNPLRRATPEPLLTRQLVVASRRSAVRTPAADLLLAELIREAAGIAA
ncbi:MAG: LysR family transcriptional regulator [Actinomycetia bacterium]|nr:LysR family transcriptional regulator [Actinomycetes bacterium]MCP4227457.1 LysR family transcriptional regulator [Actinomycetes bacterium]MCP5030597.1 LysR family transcriptional regulator [Actinomycetes bacterium]